MSKTLSSKWIDALRSGKYKQGQGYLKTIHDEYCCLGVLCDVINPLKWSTGEESNQCYSYRSCDFAPDFLTKNELGGSELEPKFNKLINMNDDERFSFDMIADEIEKDEELCHILDSLDLSKLDKENNCE